MNCIANSIKKMFYNHLNGDMRFPEIKLIPKILNAITYVESIKTSSAKMLRKNHAYKTNLAVDCLMQDKEIVDTVANIMDTENEDQIRGFIFAKTKYIYDNKFNS